AALDSVALPLLRLDPDRICRTERVRRFGVTIVWFGLTLLLAVLIPNIGDVISLLGSLAAVFIFIFPGLCLFKIGLDDASWLKQLAAAVFLVLGSFIFGVTTVQSISNLI
uniref:Aa_trans domain-containing protein n=2 Tax=Macrostomum lignano TaxID=282301 RepID=A0A1I8GWZ8_9PLAT